MPRGDVYRHEKWVFKDGSYAPKLLIILDEQIPFLVVKTTSKFKGMRAMPGCLATRGEFMIAARTCPAFPVDTLVQLTDIYEWDVEKFMKDVTNNKIIPRGAIPKKILDDLMECLRGLQDDVEEKYYNRIFRIGDEL